MVVGGSLKNLRTLVNWRSNWGNWGGVSLVEEGRGGGREAYLRLEALELSPHLGLGALPPDGCEANFRLDEGSDDGVGVSVCARERGSERQHRSEPSCHRGGGQAESPATPHPPPQPNSPPILARKRHREVYLRVADRLERGDFRLCRQRCCRGRLPAEGAPRREHVVYCNYSPLSSGGT